MISFPGRISQAAINENWALSFPSHHTSSRDKYCAVSQSNHDYLNQYLLDFERSKTL